MRTTIELEYEQVQSIVIQELKNDLETMMRDLVDRKNDKFGGGGVFDTDKDIDITLIENK
jgi:hypothetical protein